MSNFSFVVFICKNCSNRLNSYHILFLLHSGNYIPLDAPEVFSRGTITELTQQIFLLFGRPFRKPFIIALIISTFNSDLIDHSNCVCRLSPLVWISFNFLHFLYVFDCRLITLRVLVTFLVHFLLSLGLTLSSITPLFVLMLMVLLSLFDPCW